MIGFLELAKLLVEKLLNFDSHIFMLMLYFLLEILELRRMRISRVKIS